MKIFWKMMPALAAGMMALLITSPLCAQWRYGRIQENLSVTTVAVHPPEMAFRRTEELPLFPGFPLAAPAHPAFKNLRNVTLADLDGDGSEEILWGADDRLFAYHRDTLLWERVLEGVVLYPPSVADLDGDGTLEIVQTTGGIPENGRIYVFDWQGNDRPGWPRSFGDRWLLASPTLSDLDGDGVREVIVNQNDDDFGWVHVLRPDGNSFSPDWPVALDARPAVTPSTADFDGDGQREIVVFSTRSRYVLGLDGRPLPGWPQTTHPRQRYSFQSPVLADLDGDGVPEIIGATHGGIQLSAPYFFALDIGGSFQAGWPWPVPDNNWTYSTPTVIPEGEGFSIFMGRRSGDQSGETLYGWDGNGQLLPGMPQFLDGGVENVISVGDVDGDGVPELVFGINLVDPDGYGFIFATEMDGSGVVPGFPLRPRGLAYLNGAALGDIDGNGTMDLAALTFTQNFGTTADSIYLHVYDLGVPQLAGSVLWGTYKGSNTREGFIDTGMPTSVNRLSSLKDMRLYPNPARSGTTLTFRLDYRAALQVVVANAEGRELYSAFQGVLPAGTHRLPLPLNNFPAGMYWINVRTREGSTFSLPVLKP